MADQPKTTAARQPKPARELAARALCEFEGNPPDIQFEGKPMWESYLEMADTVLSTVALAPPAGQLEHVPVRAYHVPRRLSQGAIATESMHGVEDRGLAAFLVSRGLAVDVGGKLKITVAERRSAKSRTNAKGRMGLLNPSRALMQELSRLCIR